MNDTPESRCVCAFRMCWEGGTSGIWAIFHPLPQAVRSCSHLGLEQQVREREHPFSCLSPAQGTETRKCACLYPNTLITINFTCVRGREGWGQAAFNLKDTQILNSVCKLIREPPGRRVLGLDSQAAQRSRSTISFFTSFSLTCLLAEPWNNINLSKACMP